MIMLFNFFYFFFFLNLIALRIFKNRFYGWYISVGFILFFYPKKHVAHRNYLNRNIVFNRGKAKSMDFFVSMESCTFIWQIIQKYVWISNSLTHHSCSCTTKQRWRRRYFYSTCSILTTVTFVRGFVVNTQLIKSDSEVNLCYLCSSKMC